MEKLDVKAHLTHVQLCEDSGCFRCSFLDLAGTWMKKLPWLTEKKGEWGLLCKLCSRHVPQLAFGLTGFNGPGNFYTVSRHADSKQHKLALSLAGQAGGVDSRAPPKKEFEEFATKRQAAGSLRSMKAVGGRWKLARLQNCLGGACQRIDAAFLLSSTCIVLHQDVRRLVLMVRFRACNDKLEVKRGLLGIHHLQDSMTESLVQGTRAILSQFVEGDEDQMAALQQKVILLNMDAAADEQLAGRLMACNDGLFPGVKQVCRDRAHAARRVISRPFKASAEIWDVFQALIWGNASMPATIQSSDVLRKVFNQYVKDMGGDRVQSISLCKQRFDSHQKATGRLILWLRPTIKTAIYATVYRHNLRDGERGALFLRSLSEERVLLLAMVADFTDEATSIIRLMDSEAGDVATHNIELDVFASRVKHLFIDEHATRSGYTMFALESLKTPIVTGQNHFSAYANAFMLTGLVPKELFLNVCLCAFFGFALCFPPWLFPGFRCGWQVEDSGWSEQSFSSHDRPVLCFYEETGWAEHRSDCVGVSCI